MAKLNLLLAALFCFLALSSAAEPQLNDVSTGDDLPDSAVPTFNPLIELPQANGQETAVVVVPELPASTESTEELTTVTFRQSLDGPRGKRLRHGHRHFKPEEMSFGNDMILSSHDKGSDDVEEIVSENDDVRRPDHRRHNHRRFEREGGDEREVHRHFGNDMILSSHDKGSDDVEEIVFDVRRPDHRRHNHRRFERDGGDEREDHRHFGNDMIMSSHDKGSDDVEEIVSENDDVRRPDHRRHNHRHFEREGDDEREDHRDGHHHRHHRFDRDDEEEREGRGQRFDRDGDEEREGRHHHHRDHHHHHHHHDGEDEDEEGGVVMKMRKFLMSRF